MAPETLRERKIRSGISGWRAVASRAMKRGSSASETAPKASVRPAPPVVGGGLDDGVNAKHQRARDQRGAGDVGAAGEADAGVAGEQARGEESGEDPNGEVDEEDPVPVDRLRDDAAGEQPDGATGGGDEAVDADRLGLLARLGEHRDDHAEDHRGGQRPADALHEARDHEHLLALGQPADQRGGGEDDEADHHDQLAPGEVAEATGEQQQATEGDQVRVDDPREAGLREMQVGLDRGQCDIHDGRVEDDHQHPRAQHVERDPAVSVGHLLGHTFSLFCPGSYVKASDRGFTGGLPTVELAVFLLSN